MMDMDAKKAIELTMEEIKEIRSSLESTAAELEKHTDEQGEENKLETIQRILEKLEH